MPFHISFIKNMSRTDENNSKTIVLRINFFTPSTCQPPAPSPAVLNLEPLAHNSYSSSPLAQALTSSPLLAPDFQHPIASIPTLSSKLQRLSSNLNPEHFASKLAPPDLWRRISGSQLNSNFFTPSTRPHHLQRYPMHIKQCIHDAYKAVHLWRAQQCIHGACQVTLGLGGQQLYPGHDQGFGCGLAGTAAGFLGGKLDAKKFYIKELV